MQLYEFYNLFFYFLSQSALKVVVAIERYKYRPIAIVSLLMYTARLTQPVRWGWSLLLWMRLQQSRTLCEASPLEAGS